MCDRLRQVPRGSRGKSRKGKRSQGANLYIKGTKNRGRERKGEKRKREYHRAEEIGFRPPTWRGHKRVNKRDEMSIIQVW